MPTKQSVALAAGDFQKSKPMKRALLFGVGWALTVLTIAVLVFDEAALSRHASYIIGGIAFPPALFTFWRARHAMPPWMATTLYWLLACLTILLICGVCLLLLILRIRHGA
jgi:hypothetical protein